MARLEIAPPPRAPAVPQPCLRGYGRAAPQTRVGRDIDARAAPDLLFFLNERPSLGGVDRGARFEERGGVAEGWGDFEPRRARRRGNRTQRERA